MPKLRATPGQKENRRLIHFVEDLLKDHDMCQEELANELNLSKQNFNNRMRERTLWKFEEVVEICRIFNTTFTVGGK